MSDVRCEHPAMRLEDSLGSQTVRMLNNFSGTQMVSAALVLPIRVIQNDKIKLHGITPKSLLSVFVQCGRICAVKQSTSILFDRTQHRSHARCMVRRERHH